MRTTLQRFRRLGTRTLQSDRKRLVVITEARQTGKSTLARNLYGNLRYINLDAIEEREGPAVTDEAQKEPGVFDKVNFA